MNPRIVRFWSLSALLVLGAAGCDAAARAADERPGESRAARPTGGVWLNTSAIGTQPFSELDLERRDHDGLRLEQVRVRRGGDWQVLDSVGSVDGEIFGAHGTTTYRGADLLGSRWEVRMSGSERARELWIDEYLTPSGEAPRYVFRHRALGDDAAQGEPLCEADVDGAATLVALADLSVDRTTGAVTARPSTLFLACTSGAVGKAVTWGYAPWERGPGEFEAALRAVRADYCGDGTSWTQPGAALQVRDAWDINAFVDASAPTEAIWGPRGALCLQRPRLSAPVTCGGHVLPGCPRTAELGDYADGMLWTKVAP